VLRVPHLTVLAAIVVLGITAWPLSQLGSEFMPVSKEGTLLFMPVTLPGLSVTKAGEFCKRKTASSSRSPRSPRYSARRDVR
jgi:Cu/Ag efflux pump CusA